MRFEIERLNAAGLPLISEVPDYPIAQLEGINGIGKSLTVRLLQICAGEAVPFKVGSQEWKSLCEGLGRVAVTVRNLRGAESLRWEIDGEQLLERSTASSQSGAADPSWFASVLRDGRPADSMDEVRSLLRVARISGDVGLVETLAEMAEDEAGAIGSRVEPALDRDKLDEAESLLGGLEIALSGYSSDLMAQRRVAAAEAKRDKTEAEATMKDALRKFERLEELAEMRARLEVINVESSALDGEIERLNGDIAEVREQHEQATVDLAAAEKAATDARGLLREMEKAERSYKYARSRVRNLTDELAEVLQVGEAKSPDDIEDRRAELKTELDTLSRRRVELDASDAVAGLIDKVQPILDAAIAAGLADQALLAADGRPLSEWPVARLAEALAERRDELRQVPNPREATNLDEHIARISAALAALSSAQPLIDQREKAKANMGNAEKISKELDEQLDAAAAEKLEQLREARRTLDEKLFNLSGQRATAGHRRAALGAPQERDVLATRLEQLLVKEGLDADGLQRALGEAERAAESERESFRHLGEIERSASAATDRDTAELATIVDLITSDPRYEWVGRSGAELPSPSDNVERQLGLLDGLKGAVARANRRFDELSALLLGVRQGLVALGASLRGQSASADFRVPELRAWLEATATQWFSEPTVSEALLGQNAQAIEVDLDDKLVAWVDGNEEARTKPLEALSSGEQAFAFTQARLALLTQTTDLSSNRLIALDEFGAFVSANRIRQLGEYLHHWQNDHTGDQILLILPANQDYAALARASSGFRADRYRRMAEALQARGWVVEEFEARA